MMVERDDSVGVLGVRVKDPDRWIPAQVVPFGVFMGFLILLQLVDGLLGSEHPDAPWWRRAPEQWIYPLQTVVGLILVVQRWRFYEWAWSWGKAVVGVVAGVVGIGFWLLPTTLYDRMGLTGDPEGWMKWVGIAARREGFDPGEVFGEGSAMAWVALVMRFVRAAVVVALVEEIFWRNFASRLVADPDGDYWKRPFGEASWKIYLVVTGLFVVAHAPIDYAGALVYGSLTYGVAVWTKSLSACVVMHGVANLLMGCYAVGYGKYGLW